jgi:hypothetical protein
MVSLLNGLSAAGAGIAQFAGTAGLEAQRADLQKQSFVLASQLAHENRTGEIGLEQAGAQQLESLKAQREAPLQAAQIEELHAQSAASAIQAKLASYGLPLAEARAKLLNDPQFLQSITEPPTNAQPSVAPAGQTSGAPIEAQKVAQQSPGAASGVASNVQQLIAYQKTNGMQTPRQIVAKLVTDPKADISGSVDNMSKALGVKPDEPVDISNMLTAAKVVQAANPQLSLDDVVKGVQEGISGRTPTPVTATPAPSSPPPAGSTATLPGSQGYMTPDQANALADMHARRAVKLQLLGIDATPDTQQAENLRHYATEYALQQTKPQTIRGEGGAVVTPQGVVQSPVVRDILGPDHRRWIITQNTIQEPGRAGELGPGVPSWAPPGTLSAVPAELSPGEKKAQEDAAADAFGEKARAQYASAQGTKRAMEDMSLQLDQLNSGDPNWYNTGAGAAWKLDVGKTLNSIAAAAGAPPIVDPVKLAAGEDLTKQTKLAGMQVLSTFFGGQREAAAILTSTQSAVPNIENTPQGAKLVLNGILEAARWQSDQHTFATNWYRQHAGDMVGSDVAFAQAYRPEMYTRRAVSMVRPFKVTDPSQMNNYLPGTHIIAPDGSERVIPGQQDVTPLPMGAQPQ